MQFNAKLQPKFYTGANATYGDDASKNYFAYMENAYIHDGVIDPSAFHFGLSILNELTGTSEASEGDCDSDGTPEFNEASKAIIAANGSIEETAFALYMAASYHGEDKIDWSSYFTA